MAESRKLRLERARIRVNARQRLKRVTLQEAASVRQILPGLNLIASCFRVPSTAREQEDERIAESA